jgi:hypothetical protein
MAVRTSDYSSPEEGQVCPFSGGEIARSKIPGMQIYVVFVVVIANLIKSVATNRAARTAIPGLEICDVVSNLSL